MKATNLEKLLAPVIAAKRRLRFHQGLIAIWLTSAVALFVFTRVNYWSGVDTSGLVPLIAFGAIIGSIVHAILNRRWLPELNVLAADIEANHPELRAMLKTAVEQTPDPVTGEFSFLQKQLFQDLHYETEKHPWFHPISFEKMMAARFGTMLSLCALLASIGALRFESVDGLAGGGVVISRDIEVTPGDTEIEKGTGFAVLAKFRTDVPDEAVLVIEPEGESPRRINLVKNLDDPVFGGTIPQVERGFNYHVEFDGKQSRDFEVGVFEFPVVLHSDVDLDFPEYTGLASRRIDDTRRITAVEGSKAGLEFTLNKPVVGARLVARDGEEILLEADAEDPSMFAANVDLISSGRYSIALVDDVGRTNKVVQYFHVDVLPNKVPELALKSPGADPDVSMIEEILFQGGVKDDFGVLRYGLGYSTGGQTPVEIEFSEAGSTVKSADFSHTLFVEELGAQPNSLVSYYLWAEDHGTDGQVRRTEGDLYFAHVREFEEILREGQSQAGGQQQGQQQGQQPGQEGSEDPVDMQRKIVSAVWNSSRRVLKTEADQDQFVEDLSVIVESETTVKNELNTIRDNITDATSIQHIEAAEEAVEATLDHLDEESLEGVRLAVSTSQQAYEALLKLRSNEIEVSRAQGQQGGGQQGQQNRRQQMLDNLDLSQAENRYQNESQASAPQTPEERERSESLDRLNELSRRQDDLNEQLRDLQAALNAAETEEQREEIMRQLKRLRDEQRQTIEDLDEARQQLARSQTEEAQESLSQLDQSRQEMQNAAEQLDEGNVSQALASGARAQEQLSDLRDDFRRDVSSQFTEEMQRMRDDARRLAENETRLQEQLQEQIDSPRRTLNDGGEREAIAEGLREQSERLAELTERMRDVSERSEEVEPLLSRQLHDAYQETDLSTMQRAFEETERMVDRGFLTMARDMEQQIAPAIDELARAIEETADSILGDEVEALRLAQQQLENLEEQVRNEAGEQGESSESDSQQQQAGNNQGQGQPGQQGEESQQRADGQGGQPSEQQQANAGGQQPGENPGGQGGDGQQDPQQNPEGRQQGQLAQGQQQGGGRSGGGNERDGGGLGGFFWNNGALDQTRGPITGEDFAEWQDRLRDVEDMISNEDLRNQAAEIRDRARALRADYKRHGIEPQWDLIEAQIVEPLAQLQVLVAEEIARKSSGESLAPIERDPVPSRFSQWVNDYYERLGKGN